MSQKTIGEIAQLIINALDQSNDALAMEVIDEDLIKPWQPALDNLCAEDQIRLCADIRGLVLAMHRRIRSSQ